jgi:DNA-binding transcriptional ArsR family regulator
VSARNKGIAKAGVLLLKREPDGELCEVRSVHHDSVHKARTRLLPDEEYRALAATFQALADPSRAKIVYSLLDQELCTCDLAAVVGISESAVSQHLKILKRLRLIKSRRYGKVVYHALDDGHIRTLLEVCVAHVRDAGTGNSGS